MRGSVWYDAKFHISVSNGRDPDVGDLYPWGEKTEKHGGWFMAGSDPVCKESLGIILSRSGISLATWV